MNVAKGAAAIGAFAAALLVFAGCGSHSREVKITSTPPGATIYINGVQRGSTPAEKVKIDFTDPESRVFVHARLDGVVRGFGVWTIDEVPPVKEFILKTPDN